MHPLPPSLVPGLQRSLGPTCNHTVCPDLPVLRCMLWTCSACAELADLMPSIRKDWVSACGVGGDDQGNTVKHAYLTQTTAM
jgi:hypothetical protein